MSVSGVRLVIGNVCWACEQPMIGGRRMLARVATVAVDGHSETGNQVVYVHDDLAGGQVVDVCDPCAVIVRRASLMPFRRVVE